MSRKIKKTIVIDLFKGKIYQVVMGEPDGELDILVFDQDNECVTKPKERIDKELVNIVKTATELEEK